MKLWKTQLSKIIQSSGFLDRLLGPWLKAGLQLMKIAFKCALAKSVLILLELTSAADAAGLCIQILDQDVLWT